MRKFDTNGLRVAEHQGKLFKASVTNCDCSSPIFLRRFIHSELLKTLDKNESAFISYDVYGDLLEIEEQFGKSNYGKIKYPQEVMFWMGYLYRYISYTRDMDTPFLFKLFPYKQLLNNYYVFHTQSMEWCIEELLEMNNLTEDFFDKNKRLKEVIRRHMIEDGTYPKTDS